MGRHAAPPRTRTRQSVKYSRPEQEQSAIDPLTAVEPAESEDLLASLLGKPSAPLQEVRTEDKSSVKDADSDNSHGHSVSRRNKPKHATLTNRAQLTKKDAPSTKSKLSAELGLTITTVILIILAVVFSYFARGLIFAVCMLALLAAVAAMTSFAYALRNESPKD